VRKASIDAGLLEKKSHFKRVFCLLNTADHAVLRNFALEKRKNQ
jgi:hypothetical protein